MPDFFTTFIKEKSPAFFAVVALFSGCLLYLPQTTKVRLGLDGFILEHNSWIGAAFLFSTVSVLVSFFVFLSKLVRKSYRKRERNKNVELTQKSYMEKLTYTEILYLIPFLTGVNSINFRQQDGTRGGLEAKDIIYRSSNMGNVLTGFAYNIQPWALDYLNNNPELYERHVGKLETPDDVKRLYRDGRPWESRPW